MQFDRSSPLAQKESLAPNLPIECTETLIKLGRLFLSFSGSHVFMHKHCNDFLSQCNKTQPSQCWVQLVSLFKGRLSHFSMVDLVCIGSLREKDSHQNASPF